jgi:hypothetical protein
MRIHSIGFLTIVTLILVSLCVLGFYRTSSAAPPQQTFGNAAAQRIEIIKQLQLINQQLKEQNELLRKGNVPVTIVGVNLPNNMK